MFKTENEPSSVTKFEKIKKFFKAYEADVMSKWKGNDAWDQPKKLRNQGLYAIAGTFIGALTIATGKGEDVWALTGFGIASFLTGLGALIRTGADTYIVKKNNY